jgi:hypothetical protein
MRKIRYCSRRNYGDKVNSVGETAIAYFFCSSLQEKTCDPKELLSSLLRQLYEQQPTIDKVMEKLFDQRGTAHITGPS